MDGTIYPDHEDKKRRRGIFATNLTRLPDVVPGNLPLRGPAHRAPAAQPQGLRPGALARLVLFAAIGIPVSAWTIAGVTYLIYLLSVQVVPLIEGTGELKLVSPEEYAEAEVFFG